MGPVKPLLNAGIEKLSCLMGAVPLVHHTLGLLMVNVLIVVVIIGSQLRRMELVNNALSIKGD